MLCVYVAAIKEWTRDTLISTIRQPTWPWSILTQTQSPCLYCTSILWCIINIWLIIIT